MPGLYGFTGNTSNVSVSNTPGLYIGSGNVSILNSAQTLDNLLANSATIGFYLTNDNSQVSAMVIGSAAGAYGNANVAGYLPTYSGVLNPGTINTNNYNFANGVSIFTTITGTYGNANVAAYLASNTDPTIIGINANVTAANAAIVVVQNNLNSYESYANAAISATNANVTAANAAIVTVQNNLNAFETYANIHFGDSNYGNSNVAAYLASNTDPTISNLNANAAVQATQINAINANVTAANAAIVSTNANLTSYESYANTAISSITTNANANTAAYLSNGITTNITTTGNVTAGYHLGDGSQLTNIVTKLVAGANIVLSPAGGQGQVTISQIGGAAPNTSTGYYGAFHDSTNQYANVATTAYVWNIGTTDATSGVTTTGNALSFAYTGVYNIQFSTQFLNTGAGSATHNANVWIRQNGVDVAATTGQVTIPAKSGSSPGAIIAGWNYVIGVTAGDTIQFVWQQDSNDSSVYIASQTAGTNPTRPSEPGIIVTATQVTSVVNAYGNANVATFLSSGLGSNSISTTGNITTGNIKSTNGYFWANGTAYSSGSTYSNANVASYLPIYSGNIGGGGSGDLVLQAGNGNFFNKTLGFGNIYYQTAAGGYINFNGPTVATANIQVNSGSYFIGDGSKLTNIPTNYGNSNVAAFLSSGFGSNTITTTGNISAGYITGTLLTANQPNITTLGTQTNIYTTGLVSALNMTATGYITASGVGTFGNVLTTNGVYWASNGAPYSSGGSSFTGNLSGSILYDGANNKIFANAYPLSTPSATWSGNVFVNQIAVKPTYTGTNILQPPSASNQIGQVVGQVVSGNIGYQSRYGTQTSAQALMGYLQSWPVTANSMNANDRIRAIQGINEVNLNSTTWGVMSTASNTAVTLVGTSGLTQIVGTGQTATAIGTLGAIINIPVTGSSNIQYATNFMATTSYNATNAYTASNIAYARMLGGTLQQTGNLTITNAVGVHTTTGWATASNKYAVLNEDSGTVIQSAGNIVANTGAYFVGDGTYLVNLPVQTGTYSNTNVAAYLASNTDPTISNLNANAASQATSINTLFSNAATQQTQINSLATNANANTAAYLTTASITVANIKSTNGYFWANGTPYSSGSGTYGNTQVAAYLPISIVDFGGNLNNTLGSGGNITMFANSTIIDASMTVGAFVLPTGGNTARPAVGAGGIRYNTDISNPEWYNGTVWQSFGNTYTPPPVGITVTYLVIAGGGGAGASDGGGGGAGGYLTGSTNLTAATPYTVTVGGGGAGSSGSASAGSNSVFGSITAIGGGYGGAGATGGNGGSGGGGGSGGSPNTAGSGTAGQGNNGGNGIPNTGTTDYPAGGGGGAGAAGSNGAANTGGNGGVGSVNNITGTNVTYAGGGGGAVFQGSMTAGTGGAGGGGNGGAGAGGSNGTANTGGGGGGGAGGGVSGGNGGSGVVIMKILTSQYTGSVTGSPSVATSGSYTIVTWTSSGTYTA